MTNVKKKNKNNKQFSMELKPFLFENLKSVYPISELFIYK